MLRATLRSQIQLLYVNTHNANVVKWFVILVNLGIFNQSANVHSLCDTTENCVLIVQPRSWDRRNEDFESGKCHSISYELECTTKLAVG